MQVEFLIVVICLKICTFVVSKTTNEAKEPADVSVVICLKICTFVVSKTTRTTAKATYKTL